METVETKKIWLFVYTNIGGFDFEAVEAGVVPHTGHNYSPRIEGGSNTIRTARGAV